MMPLSAQSDYAKILPFILAILLIFIIPMMMRRYGLDAEDLLGIFTRGLKKKDYDAAAAKKEKKKREPYRSNSRSGDLRNLVSTLLIFARSNKVGLVYPGTVVRNGETATLLALVVTREEVVGINCFGYGGVISRDDSGKWNQHMNGYDQEIMDPVKACETQRKLLRAVMDENGMRGIPMRVVAVFTARGVEFKIPGREGIFDTEGLIADLRERAARGADRIDPDEIAVKLNEHVVRINKQSGKDRRKKK